MALFACGINHKTAPLCIREQVSIGPDVITQSLQSLVSAPGIHEAAILSTCNRTEIYCNGDSLEQVIHWLKTTHLDLEAQHWADMLYSYDNREAVDHITRVTCGLDSMVLGEPQIFGQMKRAFEVAVQAGTAGALLSRLFPHVFSAAKRIRKQTAIGHHPVSIAYGAVDVAKRIFADLSSLRVLLVGAGDTTRLLMHHLQAQGVKHMTVANRTLEGAMSLAETFNAQACGLVNLHQVLADADMVFSATASPLPVLGKGMVESALKTRRHKPMLMVDLAVPRDIEPEVAQLSDVYLYCVDDLQSIIEHNVGLRRAAAQQAEQFIAQETAHFMGQLKVLDSVPTICEYRDRMHGLKAEALAKALRCLDRGEDPKQVVTELARRLSNQLMHYPSVQLRTAAYEGHTAAIALTQRLLTDPSPSDDPDERLRQEKA